MRLPAGREACRLGSVRLSAGRSARRLFPLGILLGISRGDGRNVGAVLGIDDDVLGERRDRCRRDAVELADRRSGIGRKAKGKRLAGWILVAAPLAVVGGSGRRLAKRCVWAIAAGRHAAEGIAFGDIGRQGRDASGDDDDGEYVCDVHGAVLAKCCQVDRKENSERVL